MKTLNYILSTLFLIGSFFACSDDHYDEKEIVLNNQDVEVVDISIIDYLESQPSYSAMNTLFKDAGIFDRITTENLQYTVFIVPDDRITDLPVVSKAEEEEELDEATFLARAHISSSSLSPSSLKEGTRVFVWNGKYVNVAKTAAGEGEIFTFSNSPVKRIIKTTNGFVYELESLVYTPKSLLEVIEYLSEDYSIFKEAILSRNEKTFDKNASVPNGVDASGNTTYDSVFVTTNPYFLHKGVNLTSEAASFTMLIPSDELITNAVKEAKEKLAAWKIERPDSIIENWCWQVGFFNKIYEPEDFRTNIDLGEFNTTTNPLRKWTTNIFGKQWRTTVNEVDLDNPVEMSNGVAYYMTKLKIPTNVLIWRLKDHFYHYTYLSNGDRDTYYKMNNMHPDTAGDPAGTRVEIQPWTPGDGWPAVDGMFMWFYMTDQAQDATLDFTGYRFERHSDGTYDIETCLVPPGEYVLSFGRGRNNQIKATIDVHFNDSPEPVGTISYETITNNNMYFFDRASGGYPEFYDPSDSRLTHTDKAKYDMDGNSIATVTVTGEEAVPVRIKFRLYNAASTSFPIFHWCLRPTENCY